jgi:Asp-tRNA(Asn)/Glu-tRNA(Gln) amidotransferase A subunit family amidase
MKVMISQPMAGKSEEQVRKEREASIRAFEGRGCEVVDTIFPDFSGANNIPLKYLAKSLEAMADVDLVYFMKGWEGARGCKIEHEAAIAYGIGWEEE